MDIFSELALEIAITALFGFFIAMFFSPSKSQHHPRNFITKSKRDRESEGCDWGAQGKIGFVSEVVKVGDSGRFEVPRKELFSSESCGSPEITVDATTCELEISGEVEVVDLTDGGIEESYGKIADLSESVDDESCVEIVHVTRVPACEETLFVESTQRVHEGEIDVDLINGEVGMDKSEEIEVLKCGVFYEIDGLKEELIDDWEGIERSELERVFGAAVVFVGSEDNAEKISSLGNDLKLRLYGLHKVAIEGPCLVPQPMALKISSRAKWNAWQQLGNMTPEVAMEQYIDILSRNVPGWIDDFGRNGKGSADAEVPKKQTFETFLGKKQGALDERNLEDIMPHIEGIDIVPNTMKKDN